MAANFETFKGVNMTEEVKVTMLDPNWTDFILADLSREEMQTKDGKEYPKVDGLRRMVMKHLGDIIDNNSLVVQTPDNSNESRTTVVAQIVIETPDGRRKTASGVADCNFRNAEKTFSKYPGAIAETRAEGRALRKLLNLRTVAYEEMGTEEAQDSDDPKYVTDTQLSAIDIIASRLKVNVRKMLKKHGLEVDKITKISYGEAQSFVNALQGLQQSGVDEDIIGYDSNWRTE